MELQTSKHTNSSSLIQLKNIQDPFENQLYFSLSFGFLSRPLSLNWHTVRLKPTNLTTSTVRVLKLQSQAFIWRDWSLARCILISRKLLKVHQKSLPARGQKKKNFTQLFKHSLACISRVGRLISPGSRDVSLADRKTGLRTREIVGPRVRCLGRG